MNNTLEDLLDDEEKEDLEQAAKESRREGTKWGDGVGDSL